MPVEMPKHRTAVESVSKFEARHLGDTNNFCLSGTSDTGATAPDTRNHRCALRKWSTCVYRDRKWSKARSSNKILVKTDISFCETQSFKPLALGRSLLFPQAWRKCSSEASAWALSTSAPLHWDPSPNDPFLSSSSACFFLFFCPASASSFSPLQEPSYSPFSNLPSADSTSQLSSLQYGNNMAPIRAPIFPSPFPPARRFGIFVQKLDNNGTHVCLKMESVLLFRLGDWWNLLILSSWNVLGKTNLFHRLLQLPLHSPRANNLIWEMLQQERSHFSSSSGRGLSCTVYKIKAVASW